MNSVFLFHSILYKKFFPASFPKEPATGSVISSSLTNINRVSMRANVTKVFALSFLKVQLAIRSELKIRALQIFCKLSSVSWINTKEEVMRREEMFIRKGGCPSGN